MLVYIAGPIAGKENGNKAAFQEAEIRVIRAGHTPVNPWGIPPDHGSTKCCPGQPTEHEPDSRHNYGCYLRADIEKLMYCDAIMFLDGWDQSRGASTEAHVAASLGIKVVEL